ncbi:hypothetical protein [Amycolatopsis cihanbeyliensis]|uniref:Vegetative cell wall protein gp1 n=1 Tax=Amycolatopsis cihanbeyliensis TaxID=1128664 RepID=A0A542DH58_AMYCI|nr:hypothetical protein [Amycolatopsis cihanbeyliensis]TQJ02402.1 hypothetical protein FB471_2128 [Amycolatopsis cihanbeyliensis]
MTGFLTELGRKLAERWVATLVLPGLVCTAVTAIAVTLGHGNWADTGMLWRRLTEFTATGSGTRQQTELLRTVVLLLVLLLASVATGLLARALAAPAESLLSGRWPSFLRPLASALTRRRRLRWQRADERGEDAERNRIALAEPRCATWIGDRPRAPDIRVYREYGLDLAAAWSRLWLLVPDTTRVPLAEARHRLDEATTLGGWAALYLMLGTVWWPAGVLGLVVAIIAWRRARLAAEGYADLVEACVDVHLYDLLDRFRDEDGTPADQPAAGQGHHRAVPQGNLSVRRRRSRTGRPRVCPTTLGWIRQPHVHRTAR